MRHSLRRQHDYRELVAADKTRYAVTREVMLKPREQNFVQAVAFFACAGVLWIRLDDFAGSEFSGAWVTGKILTMADIGVLLFLSALIFTFLLPRAGAVIALAAIVLCLPFYIYVVMPGAYRQILKGEYSVPLQKEFVWNSWAITGIVTLTFAASLSIRRLLQRSRS